MTALVRVANELEAENLLLRQLLWAWHGCPSEVRYGVGGELQCHGTATDDKHRYIDFKRESVEDIQTALQEPSLRFIHAHQDDRCRHCGVTRWTYEASAACEGGAHEWETTTRPEGTERG